VLFAHDTEVALANAAALVNTGRGGKELLPDVAALDDFLAAWSWTTAGTVRSSVATPIRISTAAPGLHPSPISAEANVPEVLKVAADKTAKARPALPVAALAARVPRTVTAAPCKW